MFAAGLARVRVPAEMTEPVAAALLGRRGQAADLLGRRGQAADLLGWLDRGAPLPPA